jgi:signal-transduction protein with cAMP-binding, CBS, and nucleotidyltransferase domain
MWQGDCGIVPIVEGGNKVVGVVTDRDICVAAATRNRAPSQIRAGEVHVQPVVCCHGGDSVQTALRLMTEHRVRRLPVVTADGTLQGVISMNDIVLEARPNSDVTGTEVLDALKAVCTHHHPPATRPAVIATKRSRAARSARVARA